MTQGTRDYLHLHFIVLVWGFTAILGKLITLQPVELVFYRTLLAAIALLVLVRITGKPYIIGNRRDLRSIIIAGLLIALHWITFFLSARLANVSVSLAGMATMSIWTGIFEPLLNKNRIRGYELIISLIGFCGMVWIFKSELDHGFAFLVAVFSAMLAALFSVINGGVTKRQDPITITFYEMTVSMMAIGLFLPVYNIVGDVELTLVPQGREWIYLILLSWVCTVYAFSASVEIMRRLSAFAVNLSINLEPIYGIALALVIFGESEKMSSGFYVGGALILLSVLIYPPINKRMKRKALEVDLMR